MASKALYPITVGVRLSVDQARRSPIAAADDRRPSSLARRLLIGAIEQYDSRPRPEEGTASET